MKRWQDHLLLDLAVSAEAGGRAGIEHTRGSPSGAEGSSLQLAAACARKAEKQGTQCQWWR